MIRKISVFALFAVFLLGFAPQAVAGIYYKAVTTTDGSQGTFQVEAWVDGPKAKIQFEESGNPMTPAGSWLVTTDGGETLYLVNPEEKTYTRFDLAAMLQTLNQVMESMGPMMDFEIANPTVKKLSEEPGGTLLGLPATHYRYRTTYDMNLKIMGMKRSNSTEIVQDIWSTEAVDAAALGVWMRKGQPTGNESIDRLIQAEMDAIQGFPLKTVAVTTMTGGKKGGRQNTTRSETVVTELDQERSIPDSTFEIPAGYEETEMMPQGQQDEGGGNPLKGLFGGGGAR